MSAGWWHTEDNASPEVRTQPLSPTPPIAPATLLHLPTPFRLAVPITQQAPVCGTGILARASRRDGRETPIGGMPRSLSLPSMLLDAPRAQHGLVKLWRAQSVDLHRLLFPPPPAPTTGEEGAAGAGDNAGVAELLSLARAKREALARRLAVVLQPPPETLLCATGPLAWPDALFPFQREGIFVLMRAPQLLLGDDMGLGKTVQVIAALRLLLFRHEFSHALIVVPASLLEQWQRELARWAPELRVMRVYGAVDDRRWQWQYRAHVTLTSYETLRMDFTGSFHCGPRRETWGVVVLDEAQKIKNAESEIARICKRVPRERAWALTGTPLENRVDDLASILEFVTGAPAPTAGPALRALLASYQLRRRKEDVLRDLPAKIITDLPLPLTPAQRRAYDRAEQEGIVALRAQGEVSLQHVLALITRLKQLCNFGPGGESAKMDDLAGRVEELTAAGHKALIFTQYVGDDSGARRIASRLRRFAPLVFTGELSLRERGSIIERFQRDDHGVLILSLRAGGVGLNLQCASYVFHFDRWWNPAVERQAEDRTHRLGQTRAVHVYRYLMTDTLEQRIHEVLLRKADLFTDFVDATSLDLEKLFSKRDLYELIGMELP